MSLLKYLKYLTYDVKIKVIDKNKICVPKNMTSLGTCYIDLVELKRPTIVLFWCKIRDNDVYGNPPRKKLFARVVERSTYHVNYFPATNYVSISN